MFLGLRCYLVSPLWSYHFSFCNFCQDALRRSEYPVDSQAHLPACARVSALSVYIDDSCKDQFLVQCLQNDDFLLHVSFPIYQLAFYKRKLSFLPNYFPFPSALIYLLSLKYIECGLVDSYFIQWVIIHAVFNYSDGQIVSGMLVACPQDDFYVVWSIFTFFSLKAIRFCDTRHLRIVWNFHAPTLESAIYPRDLCFF